MQFQVQELVKIIRTRVKSKDINMKLFYKLLLNIKSWYICWCLHIKILNKPPVTILQCHKPAKTVLFDWTTSWKLLIFIIRFSQGETDQVSGSSFMLSSVVKFGQILPLRSTHFRFFFADFHWDMSGNWINIYNLCYHTVVLKKITETFTIALLGLYLGKN